MLDFKKGVKSVKRSRAKPRIRGHTVKFDRNNIKLYVEIEDVKYVILNHIFLKAASGKMELYSMPIANDKLEGWTLKKEIDATVVWDRLVLLKPIWSSVKEGSKVEGRRVGKGFEITEILKV